MKRAAVSVLVLVIVVGLIFSQSGHAPLKKEQASDNETGQDLLDDSAGLTQLPIQNDGDIPDMTFGRLSATSSGGNFDCTIDQILEARRGSADDDVFVRSRSALVNTLSASNIGEHVFVASLLNGGKDPDRRRGLVARALRLSPNNPVLGLWATELCRDGSWAGFCDGPDALPAADAALASNGAYWAAVAANKAKTGDSAGALAALKRATTAPQFDSYWGELVVLVSQSLAVSNDLDYVERIGQAIGYVAALPLSSASLYRSCKDYAATSPAWLDTCIGYAARQADDARTVMGKMIGLRLQRELLGAAGYQQRSAEVSAMYAKLRRQFNESWTSDMAIVFMTDARFVARYIDELVAGDEFAALNFAIGELERLKADPNYNPCQLAGVPEIQR